VILELHFRSSADFKIEKVNEKFSSVIYKILSSTAFQDIHDKSHTPFIFSPFRPFLKDGRFEKNRVYKIEFRSPNFELLKEVQNRIEQKSFIELDYNRLYHKESRTRREPQNISKVKTVTPIVLSISERLAEKHGIIKKHSSTYWTPEMSFQIFVEAMNRSMVKKWNFWNPDNLYPEDIEVITGYQLLKNYPIAVPYKKGKVLGSLWKLQFDGELNEIVRFNYLSGFGGKSGGGFGYVI